ncbi:MULTISPECIES: PH domain-containing protein [Eubacteriales]|uniref:PH domain-containing protein n=1 Tax=Bittarella massiliensis (ex Durand et al. 2017) TaxID=1720313 RepID=A0AAQ1RVH9_9FIRM|nr:MULTISPECIES: PH domain-containing protein [Eubacteriales]MZL70020.1 PH domain-containing protein [Bittarella massiliensis (ex Durand et al. 2017)]MZL80582.1 PH domain-containing protein [Bittarella massiliensis (ex Durand et al. 2017)]SHF99113.1 Uncharacterized membrane protein YdbT, contains bPH2 (pleckstrin homology) domain [Bittarella massiliensis (ex Durand et al. 2017)]
MKHHTHPITVFQNMGSFLFLLIIPLARGALSFGASFSEWLSGAWVDILALCAIIGMAVLRWYCIYYYFTPEAIHISEGIFAKHTVSLPFSRLTSLYLEEPFWYKPFGAVTLRLDTDAGSARSHDATLTLKKRAAVELLGATGVRQRLEDVSHRQIFMCRNFYVVILSLITTNYFAGVLFCSTFISKLGDILGQQIADVLYGTLAHVAQLVAVGIPPVALFIATLLAIGWGVSFLRNLTRYYNFCITRSQHRLFITGGVLVGREYTVAFDKIHFIDIRQTLFTRIAQFYSVYIKCAGYGKNDGLLPVLIPSARKSTLFGYLERLVPEFVVTPRTIKPNLLSIFKFIIDPLGFLVAVPVFYFVTGWLLPSWHDLISFVSLMSLVPIFWFLGVRICDFCTTGISEKNGYYTLRYSQGFTLHTVVVHRDKICDVCCRQSILQMGDDACDLFLYTYGEGVTRHHLKNLPRRQVCALFGLNPEKSHSFSPSHLFAKYN